jgi:hypothetical protein
MRSQKLPLGMLLLAAVLAVCGCGLLGSDDAEQESAAEGASEQAEGGSSDEVETEKIIVDEPYDTTDIRVKGTVGGMRFQVPELTDRIDTYGLVNVLLDTDARWGFLPWRVQGPLGQLEIDYAYEESWVYVLFTTEEEDVVRSALPTGRARIVLTRPRDTVLRTDSNHRLLFFESELKQIGFWGERD